MRATRPSHHIVTILGAASVPGQVLAYEILKDRHVRQLRVHDWTSAPGIAADLAQIPTHARVFGFTRRQLRKAVRDADLILVCTSIPRKFGMTREDLFPTNAALLEDALTHVATTSPKAIIGVLSDPINALLPVAAETLKKAGVYDPRKLFGITTLDIVRARTFVAEALGKSPYDIDVPVIGGHSGETIVPLLSRFPSLSEEQVKALTHRIQFGGDEVVKAKAGAGSATLSMAYAGAEWATAVLRALRGEDSVVECTYVESPLVPTCAFFSSPVQLGKNGVEKIFPLPHLSPYETEMLQRCVTHLQADQRMGVNFMRHDENDTRLDHVQQEPDEEGS